MILLNLFKMKSLKVFLWSTVIICFMIDLSLNAQEMPEAQKNLQRFVGTWLSKDMQMTMGDKTYPGEFVWTAKSVLDGTGVYAEESFTNADLGSMNGLNLMSYDPNLQQIHWYTIESVGICHDHLGYWSDRDHFYAQYQGIVGGQIYVEKIYFHFLSDNKLDFKLLGETNGVVTEKGAGTFTRK